MHAFRGYGPHLEIQANWNGFGKAGNKCESHVQASEVNEQDPEYHETRETLWEVGGTTPQG